MTEKRKIEIECAKKLLSLGLSEESKLVLFTQFPELKEEFENNK